MVEQRFPNRRIIIEIIRKSSWVNDVLNVITAVFRVEERKSWTICSFSLFGLVRNYKSIGDGFANCTDIHEPLNDRLRSAVFLGAAPPFFHSRRMRCARKINREIEILVGVLYTNAIISNDFSCNAFHHD